MSRPPPENEPDCRHKIFDLHCKECMAFVNLILTDNPKKPIKKKPSEFTFDLWKKKL